MAAGRRVHAPRPNRAFQWTALAFVALALGLPACAGRGEGSLTPPTGGETGGEDPESEPGRPPALVDLEGLWRMDGRDLLVQFRLDGTYTAGVGIPDFPPNHLGTFQIEGSRITFTIREAPRATSQTRALCGPGDKWVWEEVELLGAGRLKASLASDTCGSGLSGTDATWTRISV